MFTQEALPRLEVVRNKKDKGTYFGPFLHKKQARSVARYLVETFKLAICNKKIENGCLDFHLGRCIGSCMSSFEPSDYLFRIQLAQETLKKDHKKCMLAIKEKIKEYNASKAFEKSSHLSYYLEHLDTIFETIRTRFHEDKYSNDRFAASHHSGIENNQEVGHELATLLGLPDSIKTIDCFDISHFQSSYLVGSCIRFTGGFPEKDKFLGALKLKHLLSKMIMPHYKKLSRVVIRKASTCLI